MAPRLKVKAMRTREQIVERIQKLLRLSEDGCNENEARLALMRAQELLMKHNIAQDELGDVSEVIEVEGLPACGRVPRWKYWLADVIADNFRCSTLRNIKRWVENGRSKSSRNIVFVGEPVDAKIAASVYMKALSYADTFCTYYLRKTAILTLDRNLTRSEAKSMSTSWRMGFVRGLSKQFCEQVIANNWELVIQTPRIVVEYVDRVCTISLPYSTRPGSDASASQDGHAKGERFGRGESSRGRGLLGS